LLRDVESTYSRFEKGSKDDTAGTVTKEDASTAKKFPANAPGDSTSHGKPNVELVDDFRIRKTVSDTAVVAEAAKSRELSFSELSSTEEATSNDDFPSIQSIFDHISVVFPCVFELSSGSVVDEKNPYVTLQPSFLEKLKSEELFLALDAAMRTFSSVGFLSKEPNLDLANPWLERLSRANENATFLGRVPMYGTYREQLQSESRHATASLDPSPSADEKKKVPGDEIVGVDDESSSSPEEPRADTAGKSASDNAKSRRSPFDMQIENVLSYSKVLHGHTSISATAMSELARPFVKVCFGPKSNYHVDINRLVVMPLPWVMHARNDDQQHDRAIDFVHLDEALRGVLRALADRTSGNSTKRASKEGAIHVTSSGGNLTLKDEAVHVTSGGGNRTSKEGAVIHVEGVVHGTPGGSNHAAKEGDAVPETTPSSAAEEAGNTPPSNTNSKKKKKKKKHKGSKVSKHFLTFLFSMQSSFGFLTLFLFLIEK
jgi:hypothetical protein